jgi:hypothetical protein
LGKNRFYDRSYVLLGKKTKKIKIKWYRKYNEFHKCKVLYYHIKILSILYWFVCNLTTKIKKSNTLSLLLSFLLQGKLLEKKYK